MIHWPFAIRGARRSPKWPALRKAFLLEHPFCEACGRSNELNVHHITPVHVAPSRELEWKNLLTLCEHRTWNCHLIVGHAGHWLDYRADCRRTAAAIFEAFMRSRSELHPFAAVAGPG